MEFLNVSPARFDDAKNPAQQLSRGGRIDDHVANLNAPKFKAACHVGFAAAAQDCNDAAHWKKKVRAPEFCEHGNIIADLFYRGPRFNGRFVTRGALIVDQKVHRKMPQMRRYSIQVRQQGDFQQTALQHRMIDFPCRRPRKSGFDRLGIQAFQGLFDGFNLGAGTHIKEKVFHGVVPNGFMADGLTLDFLLASRLVKSLIRPSKVAAGV